MRAVTCPAGPAGTLLRLWRSAGTICYMCGLYIAGVSGVVFSGDSERYQAAADIMEIGARVSTALGEHDNIRVRAVQALCSVPSQRPVAAKQGRRATGRLTQTNTARRSARASSGHT